MSTDTIPVVENDAEADEENVEIRSPVRPFPRSARRQIADEVTILAEIKSDEGSRNGGLIVDERPPEDILNNNDLVVIREPGLEYETDSGEPVEIYLNPGKVEINGEESNMTPAEAVERAEKSDRFARIRGDPSVV